MVVGYTNPKDRVFDANVLSPAHCAFLPDNDRATNAAVSGVLASLSAP